MNWEEYSYQLSLIHSLLRAMPAPPPLKDKERRAIWEKMMEDAIRVHARELLHNWPKMAIESPPTTALTEAFKDPAETMWVNFINHLNQVQPLRSGHKSFLGSIAHYRQIFMEANK